MESGHQREPWGSEQDLAPSVPRQAGFRATATAGLIPGTSGVSLWISSGQTVQLPGHKAFFPSLKNWAIGLLGRARGQAVGGAGGFREAVAAGAPEG